jgi:hypothetical protein
MDQRHGLVAVLALAAFALLAQPAPAQSGQPAMIESVPSRFRGTWVYDKAHCTGSFPHPHLFIAERGMSEGPSPVTGRRRDTPFLTISVMSGRPDEIGVTMPGAPAPAGSLSRLFTLMDGDRTLRIAAAAASTDLFRCR